LFSRREERGGVARKKYPYWRGRKNPELFDRGKKTDKRGEGGGGVRNIWGSSLRRKKKKKRYSLTATNHTSTSAKREPIRREGKRKRKKTSLSCRRKKREKEQPSGHNYTLGKPQEKKN